MSTLKQIAIKAGVSVATVSLVLNNKGAAQRISLETIKKVKDVLEAENFRPNHQARELRLQCSSTVGLIIPDILNPFYASLTDELEQRCREEGLQLLMGTSRDEVELEQQLLEEFIQRGVKTLVISSSSTKPTLLASPPPIVYLDRAIKNSEHHSVSTDHYKATRSLLQKLLTLSPLDVVFIGADPELISSQERRQGFLDHRKAQESLKTEPCIYEVPKHKQSCGKAAYKAYCEKPPKGSHHLFFSSYTLLEGFLLELRSFPNKEIQFAFPLLCFDSPHQINFFPYPLLYVLQDHRSIVTQIARFIQTKHGSPIHSLIEGEICMHM